MNHIKVELDFIPVDKFQPDKYGRVFQVRLHGVNCVYAAYQRSDGHGEWRQAISHELLMDVTHWAEIPEMK